MNLEGEAEQKCPARTPPLEAEACAALMVSFMVQERLSHLGLKPRKLICLQSQATDVFLLPPASALRLISQLIQDPSGNEEFVF